MDTILRSRVFAVIVSILVVSAGIWAVTYGVVLLGRSLPYLGDKDELIFCKEGFTSHCPTFGDYWASGTLWIIFAGFLVLLVGITFMLIVVPAMEFIRKNRS